MPKPDLLYSVLRGGASVGADIALEGALPALPWQWIAESSDHSLLLRAAFAIRNISPGDLRLSLVGPSPNGASWNL